VILILFLWLLKKCSGLLVPTITNIVNLSLSSGNFHHTLKESAISPLLIKPTLDKDEMSNYRPISNLSLVSKIIERIVKSRLSDHLLASNNLLNPHQTAYSTKHHTAETALLYIHDHLINAHAKFYVSAFPIYLPPSTPSTTLSYSLVCRPGLAFKALL